MVNKKGFTLLELIIVIAVIAILATTVILVLNPVNILQEARDSQRIADLGQMSSALGLYLATVQSPSLGDPNKCYVYTGGGGYTAPETSNGTGCDQTNNNRHGTKLATVSSSRAVDGNGWIPVNLTAISGGSPLSNWPIDPKHGVDYYYSYATDGSQTYELNADMESAAYSQNGDKDVESTDGGNANDIYEVGNDPGLDL